jgi:3-oxoacyl-[acyl-carrier-protein] synthase-3
MDGMDVFNFAIRVVPKGVKEMLKVVDKDIDYIDQLVFHQSNRFMTDFFVKKLKVDSSKVPYCIDRFGNTSSASVPLTIVSELKDKLCDETKVVMCGFGAGLSWGTALVPFKNCRVSNLIEY